TADLGDGDSPTSGEDVSVQLDGRIIVVGQAYRIPDFDFFTYALGVNGEDQGVAFPAFGETDGAVAVKQDGENRVYVVGNIDKDAGSSSFTRRVGLERITLDRLDSSGDFNKSFSLPGRTVTSVKDLVVLPGGKFVIAGNASIDSGSGFGGPGDFFIARFNA